MQVLEISQPTFFRYFPSKDAVLREIGRRAFARQAESLKSELSSKASTAERLERFYDQLAKVTETGRPLWQAVILAGAMDPVRSPELRGPEQATVMLLREILEQGQLRGEITKNFPWCIWPNLWKGCSTRWCVSGPWTSPDRTSSPSALTTPWNFFYAAQGHKV